MNKYLLLILLSFGGYSNVSAQKDVIPNLVDSVQKLNLKNEHKFRVDIQPVIGILLNNDVERTSFSSQNDLGFSGPFFQYGVLSNIYFSNAIRNLSLKTGLIMSRQSIFHFDIDVYYYDYVSTVKIPVQASFSFGSKRIKPFINYGLNINVPKEEPILINPCIGLGMNVRIDNHLFVSLFTDIDYYDKLLFFLPTANTKLLALSLNIGVGVKL